jgi:cytochrome c556
MQQLEKDFNSLSSAIILEDYNAIEKAAIALADHPQPKDQLPLIAKKLGGRLPDFKSFDGRVHDSAKEIAKLVKKKDMKGILHNYSVVIENCMGCHVRFRSEISTFLNTK